MRPVMGKLDKQTTKGFADAQTYASIRKNIHIYLSTAPLLKDGYAPPHIQQKCHTMYQETLSPSHLFFIVLQLSRHNTHGIMEDKSKMQSVWLDLRKRKALF